MNEESRLRERYGELRADLARRTPSFRSVVERRPPRRALRLPVAAVLCLMLLLAIAVVLLKGRVGSSSRFSSADYAAARSVSAWHSPTGFLLRTPGHELLDSVPAVTSIRIPPALLPSKGASQ